MKQKQILIISIAFIFAIFLTSNIFAVYWQCFNNGDKINFCNPKTPDRTCKSSTGCFYCMDSYNSTSNCYVQGSYPVCVNTLPPQQCGSSNNGSYHLAPPVLTINSPVNNQIYNSKAIPFSLTTDELATIYYKNNANSGDNWKKIATKVTTYSGSITLKDGLNDITIKAVDLKGNENTTIIKFRVDSQKPKITKINPTKGFASGRFDVWFSETNPKTLVLTYGNQINGIKTANVNLNSCSGDPVKGKYNCTIIVPLNVYNGQSIDYSFRLTDIANNIIDSKTGDSKTGSLNVDVSNPIINNIGSLFSVNGKNVYFNMSINEPNLLAVSYYDNSIARPRWIKLCSSLKDGICAKKVNFQSGNHAVDIKVDDKAGNSITTHVEFNIA